MARLPDYSQYHFILYELVLPYCTVCTPADGLTTAWHTPITCEESSDSEYRLWLGYDASPVFITQPTPSIAGKSRLNSEIFKCVTSASETTPKLKGGEGIASRGTMSIKCADFSGDPGPINFSDGGTFFGKLLARNILDNKKIITHYYSVVNDVVTEVDTSTHFITNTQLTDGVFTLSAKDALKDVEAFGKQFPDPSEITLTADINATTTTIPVSDGSDFVSGSVFVIDGEVFRVTSKSGNNLTVATRGSSLSNPDGTLIYDTVTEEHSADSTVQPCYVMSKTPLQDFLQDVFTFADLVDFIDYTQWTNEITEWNADAFLYGIIHEPQPISDLLEAKLTDYLIDMWLDQSTQKIRISAVSAWKESVRILEEGNDLSSLKIKTQENTRFSRAYIYNTKRFQTNSDEVQNYSKLTLFTDVATEDSDLYGTPKVKDFGFSNTITSNSAQILCSRYVQRYSKTPKLIDFTMEERKLAGTNLGDIVDIVSRNTQSPSGEFLIARDRAQVIKIQPSLNNIGRQYNVSALAYVPLIASDPGEELFITLSGTLFDENLFARAGAPNVPINVTFIFDGCTIGSTANNIPSVRAGNFEAGSRIRIICINDTKWSAIGGDGGSTKIEYATDFSQIARAELLDSATAGGDSYRSDGITTEIYLNYGTVAGYNTDSTLYAAGGGAASGGAVGVLSTINSLYSFSWVASGGGSGIPGGKAGSVTVSQLSFGNAFDTVINGNDGVFSSGGTSSIRSDGRVENPLQPSSYVETTISGGNGGSSINGAAVTSVTAISNPSSLPKAKTPTSNGGQAGGAIKGSGVTVFNLAAQSGRFRQGNSDSFTLVDS